MTKKRVTVQISTNMILDDHTMMLGEQLVKAYKIPTNQMMTVRFGSVKQQIRIVPVPRYDGLRMNGSLGRKLGLHHGTRIRLQYRLAAQTLILGPILAVMVNRVKTSEPNHPFGSITSFCKELTDACQAEGIMVYFFSPAQIRKGSPTIEGWYYYGGWHKSTFPIPNVVYNRLTSRILENMQSVQHFMNEVKSVYKTKIFNEKFLNKTEVFQALKKDRSLHKYLPESHPCRSFQMLKAMCSRYRVVFLKPILGSLGKGIIRITRQPNKTFACHFATVNGTKVQTYSSITKVYAAVSGKLKARRYQIQQGLNLITHGTRPIDFRALVQKNTKDQWEVTSIVARIAGNHHFVSNLARGGTLSPVKEAIYKSNLPSSLAAIVHARLRKAAVEISQGIEKNIDHKFGELGVDLAVDQRGRVWLLEVNSKPSKNDNTPLTDNKIRPSVRQVAKYVRHLSGF